MGFFSIRKCIHNQNTEKSWPYWILLRRHKAYTHNVGILCPTDSIKMAKKLELESRAKREEKREQSKRYRDKGEHNYRNEMEELMFSYLNFSRSCTPILEIYGEVVNMIPKNKLAEAEFRIVEVGTDNIQMDALLAKLTYIGSEIN